MEAMFLGALTNLMQISRWMPFGYRMLQVSGATGTYFSAYGAFFDMENYRYDAGGCSQSHWGWANKILDVFVAGACEI